MKPSILIIGSTGTIGKQLVYLALNDYSSIIISGRNTAALKKQKSEIHLKNPDIEVHILELDIANDLLSENLDYFIKSNHLVIDCIINTSYYAHNGVFTDVPINEHQKIIETNVIGFMRLIYWFIKYCENLKIKPKVLCFSSMCSLYGIPNTSSYSGTKSFLVGFGQSIHNEYKELSISISCPGPFSESEPAKNILKSILNKTLPSPESIAKKSYRKFKKGKVVIYPDIISILYRYKFLRVIFIGFLKKFYKY